MSPVGGSGTMALLARVCPARQFNVETKGSGIPPGTILTSPSAVGCVTVKLYATALAVAGIPHWPAMVNERSALALSAGPPYGPTGLRVSATRHGGTV